MQYIYQKKSQPKKVISNAQRRILITEFLKENAQALTYFTTDRITEEGLIRRIEQMVMELGRFGYSAKNLQEKNCTSFTKINDFALLMRGLQNKLGASLTDELLSVDDVLSNLDHQLFIKMFPRVESFYLNGYGLFTPPMIRFLGIIKSWLDIEVKIDYVAQNSILFAHTKPAFESLSILADKIIKYEPRNEPLALNLFNSDAKTVQYNKSNCIKMFRDKESEVSGIAAEVRRLHKEKGLPWHRIGITFPDQESYSPLIRTIFNSYDIPFNLSTGFALSQSSLVQTILRLLQTVSDGYRLEDVIDLLGNPFLNHEQAGNRNRLKRLAVQSAIKQFSGSWYEKLQTPSDRSGKTLHTLKYVDTLIKKFGELEQRQTAVEFRDTFYHVMKELGLLTWYQQLNPYLDLAEKEKEYRAFNRFVKLFDQLIWFLDYLFPDKQLEVADYFFYLKSVVRDALYNIREWSNYGVQIMPRLEIQSVEYQVLFIGGMVEGVFPRAASTILFFNEHERKQLGLYSSEDILNQDRFQFYQLLVSIAERVILTLPSIENEKSQMASTFLSALQTSAGVPVQQAATTPEDLSDVQLRSYFGRQLCSQPAKEVLLEMQQWATTQNPKEIDLWLTGIDIYRRKKNYDVICTYEGNLTSAGNAASYLNSYIKEHAFSVTALEQYAFCPIQYFFSRILKIQAEEEFDAGIPAISRGRLIHEILHSFYTGLQSQGDSDRPWQFPHLLQQITEEMMQKLDRKGITVLLEKEQLLGSGQQAGMWKTFLEHEEKEIPRIGFTPVLFEWSFGRDKSFSLKGNRGTIYLAGTVDRIDMDAQGNFIVFDYKTGQTAQQTKIKEIYDGSSIQLPVYLAAVERLAAKVGRPAAAAWFQVKDSENCRRVYVITDVAAAPQIMADRDGRLPNKKYNDITLALLIERTLARVMSLVEEILDGQFRHTRFPRDKRCSSYCRYNIICRKDVTKLLHLEETIHDRDQ
jgi:ATP-dependent helicase/nuclease subunit B